MDDASEMHTALTQRQQALTTEIQSIDQEVSKLEVLKRELKEQLHDVNHALSEINTRHHKGATTADLYGNPHSKGVDNPSNTDYFGKFVWSGELKRQMKLVFGFDDFRLCQEG